ncbi:radical SAM protein [Vibrio parahaemolyticus]|nr:radical SAM protein [Vibrio parahaemolyticus]
MADYIKNLSISPKWQIRNDGSYFIAFKLIPEHGDYYILTIGEAILACSLINSFKPEELLSLWDFIFGTNAKSKKLLIDSKNNLIDKKILIKTPTHTNKYDNTGQKIDITTYNSSAGHPKLSIPLKVNISFTEKCKSECRYCYAERKYSNELQLEDWIFFFDRLKELGICKVDISGGDITCRKDYLDIIREMLKRNFIFMLSTKSPISKKEAHRLAKMGLGHNAKTNIERPIQLSIDSADPAIASYLTRNKNHLKNMAESAKNLLQEGINPRIKCVVTPINICCVKELFNYFYGIGIRYFVFTPYYKSHFRHDDSLELTKENKVKLDDKIKDIKIKNPDCFIELRWSQKSEVRTENTINEWRRRSICSAGRTELWIKSNGDVTPCEQLPHIREFVFGNVIKEDLISIWNSTKIDDFNKPKRSTLQGSLCIDCDDFTDCHRGIGYCYRDSFWSTGSIHQPPPDCPYNTI